MNSSEFSKEHAALTNCETRIFLRAEFADLSLHHTMGRASSYRRTIPKAPIGRFHGHSWIPHIMRCAYHNLCSSVVHRASSLCRRCALRTITLYRRSALPYTSSWHLPPQRNSSLVLYTGFEQTIQEQSLWESRVRPTFAKLAFLHALEFRQHFALVLQVP